MMSLFSPEVLVVKAGQEEKHSASSSEVAQLDDDRDQGIDLF